MVHQGFQIAADAVNLDILSDTLKITEHVLAFR
jgi:hypothetical protein